MTIGKRITNVLTVGALILSAGVAQANVEWVGPGNPATGVWEDPNNWWDGTINRLPINNEWIRPSTNATIIYSDASGTNLLPNSLFWWDTGLDHHTVIQTGGELQVSGLQMTQDKTDTNAPAYTISGGKLTAGSMNITWNNSSSVGSKFLQTGGTVTLNGLFMASKSSTQQASYDLQNGDLVVNGPVYLGNGSLNHVTDFTQSGGTATVRDYIRMGQNLLSGGSSIVNLDGGTLTIKNDSTPIRFIATSGPFINTSTPSYVKEGDGWKGAYWAVVDADPGPAEEWVAEQQLNKWLQQIWTNTVTQTGAVTLGFDLALKGDSSMSFAVFGWRKDELGVGDDSNGNALQGSGWNVACQTNYVADVLLGTGGDFFTNMVVDGNEKVQKYYNQSTEGVGLTVALDPDVDLSQYDYIGINIFNADYGVQLDNISLTTADGGEALIDVPGFDKADLEPLVAGNVPTIYVDFDGGKLNLKGTWDFAKLTGLVASDFRAAGVPVIEGDLKFTPITIDVVDYTQIEVLQPPGGTVFMIK